MSSLGESMALLLGAQGVGKTLLSKRLYSCSSKGSFTQLDEPPATIPTVGTNLVNITLLKKQELTIREVGGCMGPIWSKYFGGSSAIIYVVDLSNRHQVSASCIQLLTVLSDERLSELPVLIVLNKIDAPHRMTRCEIDSLVRLDDMLINAVQEVKVVEASAREGNGLSEIMDWIQEHCKGA